MNPIPAIAILDDYQGLARRLADWTTLPAGIEVASFAEPAHDEDGLVARLNRFDVVVAMRERSPSRWPSVSLPPTRRCGAASGSRSSQSR